MNPLTQVSMRYHCSCYELHNLEGFGETLCAFIAALQELEVCGGGGAVPRQGSQKRLWLPFRRYDVT